MIRKSYILLFLLMVGNLFSENPYVYSVLQRKLDEVEKQYDVFAKRRVESLLKMMNKASHVNEKEKLVMVNRFFNAIPYASDQKVWQVKDYWATRVEFLGKDRGDCEDYVIAKYFTLKELGVPASKLYMTYGMSTRYRQPHLVLSYYETPASIPLILDNYNQKILSAKQRKDIIPIYSFLGEDIFHAKQVKLGRILPGAANQKKPWDSLHIKRQKEL